MRRFFVIILIATLPLRAWAGDMMAVGMMAKNVNMPVAAHLPCAEHDAGESGALQQSPDSTEASDASEVSPSAHCDTCVACQICHSVALASPAILQAPAVTTPAQPASRSARFASALLAIGLKPPIS